MEIEIVSGQSRSTMFTLKSTIVTVIIGKRSSMIEKISEARSQTCEIYNPRRFVSWVSNEVAAHESYSICSK